MTASLGNRMKRYEEVNRYFLTPRSCVIIRVDGRAFHSLTKSMKKPFDDDMMSAMVDAAETVARQMQGFKLGYVQSDEASFFLTDFDKLETQGWFGYELNKMVSISASLMASSFLTEMVGARLTTVPTFDSRAFNIPSAEVANYFLWRAQDWERNSLQMYAQSIFSHNQLQNKRKDQIHEMLHQKGKNWATDLSDVERNGTFLVRGEQDAGNIVISSSVLPKYSNIVDLVGPFIADYVGKITSQFGTKDST